MHHSTTWNILTFIHNYEMLLSTRWQIIWHEMLDDVYMNDTVSSAGVTTSCTLALSVNKIKKK